jgi:hypothetical protein
MEEMAGPASIVFPLHVAVLERLWGQPFDCLNYEKESGIIKTRGFQISVPKRNITLATSNNLGAPILTWSCGRHDHVKNGGHIENYITGRVFFFPGVG